MSTSKKPNTPEPTWWIGLSPEAFYAEVKRRDEARIAPTIVSARTGIPMHVHRDPRAERMAS